MYNKRKIESVQSGSWQRYIEGYRRWLELHNYVASSIQYDPVRIAEFLRQMELQGVSQIEEITSQKVEIFFDYLSKRKSKNTGDLLTLCTMRSYLTAVNRFARYLRDSGEGNIAINIKFKGSANSRSIVFSKAEIERLYQVTDDSLLGIRDRAMLAVFYGCGVRKSEGSQLEIRDILPDKNLLYVRKGKGYKERYIPMVGKVKKDILDYVVLARPMLLGNEVNELLFVGRVGKPLGSQALYERFKRLMRRANMKHRAGLHALRHSIATHLLIEGMKLSQIAKFLGHRSLESTQIYTHLRNEI